MYMQPQIKLLGRETEGRRMRNLLELLLYAGAKPEEFKKCADEIRSTNHKKLKYYLSVSSVLLALMTGVSCVTKDFGPYFLLYSVPFVICMALLMVATSFANISNRLLMICIYLYLATMFGFSIILGVERIKDAPATTFQVLLVLMPLLFTMRPILNIINIILADSVFLMYVRTYKTGAAAQTDMLNGLLFGAVSVMVSTYLMTSLVENAIVRGKLGTVAESDLNTNLKNRNAYENHLQEFPLRCTNSLSCVFVDVNGLHELNNLKGHAEGDKMLRIVADKLKDEFGDDCFRVGGDEFVAFAFDESYENMRRRISSFEQAVDEEGYSVAVGTATHSAGGIDVDFLVKTAEQRMYMAKEEHYRRLGINHDEIDTSERINR